MGRDTAYWERRLRLGLQNAGVSGGVGLAEQLAANQWWLEFGEVHPTPLISWMYEYGGFRRFAQCVWITLPPNIVASELEAVLQALLDRHAMLRAHLEVVNGSYRLVTRPPDAVRAAEVLTKVCGPVEDVAASTVGAVIDSIDPFSGAMVRALWCDGPGPGNGYLLLVVHSLAIDVVSWYVLGAGMAQAWTQLIKGENAALPGEYTTYRQWSRMLHARSYIDEVVAQRDYWLAQLSGGDPALGSRMPDPHQDTWASLRTTEAVTEVGDTRLLLDKVASTGAGLSVRDFLVTALIITLHSWRLRRGDWPPPDNDGVLIQLENHGRHDALFDGCGPRGEGADTSATVGVFTQMFPVRLGSGRLVDVGTVRQNAGAVVSLLQAVAEEIAAIPNNGLDYGLLRYDHRDPEILAISQPQVMFNYLGRFDLNTQAQSRVALGHHDQAGKTDKQQPAAPWHLVTDSALNSKLPQVPEPDLPLRHVFHVNTVVHGTEAGPQVMTFWRWSDRLTTAEEAAELAELWLEVIAALAQAL